MLLFGFSIDGLLANRFSLLQPQLVEAFAAGGAAGEISLPMESIDGYPLRWWFGVNNIFDLTGEAFQPDLYREISQYYFWGDQDLEHYHLEEGCRTGSSEFCHWYSYWGQDLVSALRNQCSFLQENGYKVTCREYSGKEHDFYAEMREDVFLFFDQVLSR